MEIDLIVDVTCNLCGESMSVRKVTWHSTDDGARLTVDVDPQYVEPMAPHQCAPPRSVEQEKK